MKILSGIMKKVLTEDQYDELAKGTLSQQDIKLLDTVRTNVKEETKEEFRYLPFRISYKDVDLNGNDKYIYNDEKEEFQKVYRVSPIIYAYNKEMRVLLEMEDYNPIKVVVEDNGEENIVSYKLICVQNQLAGKLDNI